MSWSAAFGVILALAAWFDGGADYEGWLVCALGMGLLGAAFAFHPGAAPACRDDPKFHWLLLAVAAYPLIQLVPVPVDWLVRLSPGHEAVYSALARVEEGAFAPLSLHPPATVRYAVRWLAYSAAAWAAAGLARRFPERVWALALPVIAVASLEAALGVAQHLADPQADAQGTYVNHNHFSGLLELSLPFAAVAAASATAGLAGGSAPPGDLFRAAARVSAAALIFAGVAVSHSRTGFLAALSSLAFLGGAGAGTAQGRVRRWLARAAAPASAVSVFLLTPSDTFIASYARVASVDGFLSHGRFWLWKDTLGLIRGYPVFGCGLGAYESAFFRYKRSGLQFRDDHAHNDYLELLAELGGAGFALAAALAGFAFWRAWRAWRRSPSRRRGRLGLACAGSAVAIAVHSAADFNLYLPANALLFSWVLGLAAGSGARVRKAKAGTFHRSPSRKEAAPRSR